MTWNVEPLGDAHALDAFDCGNDVLSNWLRIHAQRAVRQGTRTYVIVDEGNQVVGYFSLAPHVVEREEAPRSIGRGAPRQVPAILLARFALDRRIQGRGFGRELLVLALAVIVEAARVAGGKMVVVDAIDEGTARFYQHHDFIPIPGNPCRLVMKLSTMAAGLGAPWPCCDLLTLEFFDQSPTAPS